MEDEIDFDNLLHANLGDVDLSNLLNLSDSAFPDDLESLDLTNLVPDQARLSLSPSSLAMATNTSYVVQEEELQVQFPNREGSAERENTVEVKGVVGRMVDQKRNYLSTQEYIPEEKAKQKVSPIKIIKGENQYQLASRKRQFPNQHQLLDISNSSKKRKFSSVPESEVSPVPRSLSCPHCGKQFPLGGQWKLTRHISTVHTNNMPYSCQYCDKQFPCQSILTAHTEWHHVTNPWQCEECGYRLGNLAHFIRHVKSVHKVTSLNKTRSLLLPAKD
eukprot:GFUD01044375.1.p1 GENE.GFUD01044375.1~~GFUD01044375.1.p1  ORF type:complete len:275 (+),score=95.66 GFUD01044375.1:552-1376(+)